MTPLATFIEVRFAVGYQTPLTNLSLLYFEGRRLKT